MLGAGTAITAGSVAYLLQLKQYQPACCWMNVKGPEHVGHVPPHRCLTNGINAGMTRNLNGDSLVAFLIKTATITH